MHAEKYVLVTKCGLFQPDGEALGQEVEVTRPKYHQVIDSLLNGW